MFGSVSSCAPNSQVTARFTSTLSQKLDIWANVTVSVNGSVVSTRPINLIAGDTVLATVSTASTNLGYRFIPYTLDDRQQYFAVVNRNNYAPTVKVTESYKRWYNYYVTQIEVSFHNGTVSSNAYSLGLNDGSIDLRYLHVVLDPVHKRVHFYAHSQQHVAHIGLPAGPIEYKKINYTNPSTGLTSLDLIVLCNDGKIYRIKFDRSISISDKFEPGLLNVFPFDDLPYQEDIPGGGSFTDQARENYLRALFPALTSLDVRANLIWLAGQDKVYVVNQNFTLSLQATLSGEQILGIACAGSTSVIVVTRSYRVYRVAPNIATTLLYSGTSLGHPGTLPDGDRVAVPDPNNQRLLIFSINGLETTWSTQGFAPAYARTFDNWLYVTGHDSNQVLQYLADNVYTVYNFKRKVTLVHALSSNYLLGTHNLQNYTVLDLTGIQKVIPFTVEPRDGAINHIGTRPQKLIMLGQESITAIPGPGITCYSDGIVNGPINTNSYFSVSYKASQNGTFRSCFIVGETAIDYDILISSSSTIKDFYSLSTAVLRMTQPFGSIIEPDTGSIDEGVTGPIPIGFDFNMYGRIFNSIYATTNGVLYFGDNYYLNRNPVFGDLPVDSLYVEPNDLYQGYPVNNVDPNNIRDGVLDTNQVPGLYVKTESITEFGGFRLRWVGTTMSSYPLGNTINTVYTTTNHPELLVTTLVGINVNDYISGTGVNVSTQVTGTQYYSSNVEVYYSAGSRFLTVDTVSLKKYSKMGTLNAYYNNAVSTSIPGNRVLAQNVYYPGSGPILEFGNVIVDGYIDANVTLQYVFSFPYNQGGISSTVKQVMAHEINTREKTITPIAIRDYTSTNSIYVNEADYNKVYVNQTIFGSNITSTRVTAKTFTDKTFTLSSDYIQIAEGFLETILNNVAIIVDGNIVGYNESWSNTLYQGTAVNFTFTATNVPNGTQFPYAITSDAGVITSADFFGQPSLTGQFNIINGSATITLRANTDLVTEGLEGFRLTVSNLSVISGETLSISTNIVEPPNSESAVLRTETFSVREHRITTDQTQQITPSVNLNLRETELIFTYPKYTAGTLFGNATYSLNENFVFESLPTVNGAVYENNRQYYLFTGNFVQITNSLTVPTNTAILFKANVPAPTVAYEVGLYTGRNYQYIEYFFDSVNHVNANIGIVAANGISSNTYIRTTGTNSTSILFGSFISNGQWQLLGQGSFTNLNQGFEPRHPRIFKADRYTASNEQRYDILIDQRFPADANVFYSIDYGFLSVNDGYYYGDRTAETNDILTVVIPFGNNQKPISVILGIGDYQVTLPAVPESRWNTIIETSNNLVDQSTLSTLNPSIVIPVAGEYMLPAIYRSALGPSPTEFEFVRTRSGANLTITSSYYDFQAGDVLTLKNLITSRRSYDVREVVVAGPRFIRFFSRTAGTTQFLPLNYGMLDQPFVRIVDELESPDSTYNLYPVYKTANIRLLTVSGSLTGKLFVAGHGATFIVNNVSTRSRLLSSVSTGTEIGIEWIVPNYFASNVVVYQIQNDSLDNSNIFVPIGSWSINNRSISGGTLESTTSFIEYQTATAYLEDAETYSTSPAFEPLFLDSLNQQLEAQITSEFYGSDGTFLTEGPVQSKEIVPGNYYWTHPVAEPRWLSQGQRDFNGQIDGTFLSNDFQIVLGRVEGISGTPTQTVIYSSAITGQWEDFYYTFATYGHQPIVEIPHTIIPGLSIDPQYLISKSISFVSNIAVDPRPIQVVTYTGLITNGLELPPSFGTYAHQAQAEKVFSLVNYGYVWDREIEKLNAGFTFTKDPYRQLQVTDFNQVISSHYEQYEQLFINIVGQGLTPISIGTGQYFEQLLPTGQEFVYRSNELKDSNYNILTHINTEQLDIDNINTKSLEPSKDQITLITKILQSENLVSNDLYQDLNPDYFYANILLKTVDPLFIQDKIYQLDFDPEIIIENILDFEQSFAPEFFNEAIKEIDFGVEFEIPNLITPDFDPHFIVSNDLYIDTDYNLLVPNDIYKDFGQQFIGSNDLYIDTEYNLIVANDIYKEFGQQFVLSNDLYIDLELELFSQVDIFVNISPLFVSEPDLNVELLPKLVGEKPVYSLLDLQFTMTEYRLIDAVYILDQEPMYETLDFVNQGAFKTEFIFYANDGRGGDELGSNKFVSYAQNAASHLVLFNTTYGPGSYTTSQQAAAMAARYVSASVVQILGTDFWNYRIHFNTRVACTPRKGSMYPKVWLIRGG